MRGSWAGLAVAVGFSALANVLLLATVVYRQWITGNALWIGYATLAGIWLLAWWQCRWERRAAVAEAAGEEIPESPSRQRRRSQQDQLFREAQQKYLESDWVAAEQLMLKLLKQNPRDVEGRLMLATLWRHQERVPEALRQLERLERLEAAQPWQREIAAERRQLEQATPSESNQDDQPTKIESTEDTETREESANRRLAA